MILDTAGEVVRTEKTVPEKGVNRFAWSQDRDGVRINTGSGRGRSGNQQPGGGPVLPGEYIVKMV